MLVARKILKIFFISPTRLPVVKIVQADSIADTN